jgi:hypothetical protein
VSDMADQRSRSHARAQLPEKRSWEAGSAREEGAVSILDPTAERDPEGRPLADRTATVRTIALVDIRKPRGDVFLDELERLLRRRGHEVQRAAKPTFTKPAPADVRKEIAARCDAVIEALAD